MTGDIITQVGQDPVSCPDVRCVMCTHQRPLQLLQKSCSLHSVSAPLYCLGHREQKRQVVAIPSFTQKCLLNTASINSVLSISHIGREVRQLIAAFCVGVLRSTGFLYPLPNLYWASHHFAQRKKGFGNYDT